MTLHSVSSAITWLVSSRPKFQPCDLQWLLLALSEPCEVRAIPLWTSPTDIPGSHPYASHTQQIPCSSPEAPCSWGLLCLHTCCSSCPERFLLGLPAWLTPDHPPECSLCPISLQYSWAPCSGRCLSVLHRSPHGSVWWLIILICFLIFSTPGLVGIWAFHPCAPSSGPGYLSQGLL